MCSHILLTFLTAELESWTAWRPLSLGSSTPSGQCNLMLGNTCLAVKAAWVVSSLLGVHYLAVRLQRSCVTKSGYRHTV